ncbi:AcrR family transcriptional regulator [Paenibacillus phyllosphaerae]|uniref:AcrR family transcriptional regulator n=1 Tax=Paenibacillus phyllosphaerae TaxID=274593 RepID=A0A7W5B201_9BACL|nr:TetR/AcrR family transcriptional regulator [Paenibacillus phyllosphaerae]MBB3112787.1 AcrR family transcriptional regulator [Paenibacillus phyllosphaerae]
MKKGQATKEHIIRESAALFNTKGYAGTSLSEIIERTHIRKGGIYNHFESKDDIALGAFDYMVAQLKSLLAEAMAEQPEPAAKIQAICEVYIQLVERKLWEGGCPIMNTAVESDDGHPLLKQRAQSAMGELMSGLKGILADGIARKQFRSDIDAEAASSVIIALIEGGVMLSKLYDDPVYIRHCTAQVQSYIDRELAVQS